MIYSQFNKFNTKLFKSNNQSKKFNKLNQLQQVYKIILKKDIKNMNWLNNKTKASDRTTTHKMSNKSRSFKSNNLCNLCNQPNLKCNQLNLKLFKTIKIWMRNNSYQKTKATKRYLLSALLLSKIRRKLLSNSKLLRKSLKKRHMAASEVLVTILKDLVDLGLID